MLKGNCRKKNLTTCESKISSYKSAFKKQSVIDFKQRFFLIPLNFTVNENLHSEALY